MSLPALSEKTIDYFRDPDNLKDISKDKPKLAASLGKEIEAWLQETGPVLPPRRDSNKNKESKPHKKKG